MIPKLPDGDVELKVLARSPDVTGVSPPHTVPVPKDPTRLPTLHLIAVGLDYAQDPKLKLRCPPNDAAAVAEAFTKHCASPGNLFPGKSVPVVLLNQNATRANIEKALSTLKVKPHDLVVFFYAGHGVRDGKEFYLLTHDANLGQLKDTALSGTRMRQIFGKLPCQVLVLLDACHSGQAGVVFRSVAEDASRDLADEECSVSLLAAAMGHEHALEPKDPNEKNGFFTRAVVEALKGQANVTHNKWDGRQYVHHLAADVLDRVQHLSEDRQHPSLSLPWTVESYAIRRVANPPRSAGGR